MSHTVVGTVFYLFWLMSPRNDRITAILDFSCNVVYLKQLYPDAGISTKVIVGVGGGTRPTEGLPVRMCTFQPIEV